MQQITMEDRLTPLQWTPRSEECFYAVVDSPEFFRQDAKVIYHALRDRMKPVFFGDYLKRYIYRKAELNQPFDAVPLSEYQEIIAESFANRGVPASFGTTKATVRAMSRNWLMQNTVSRDTVLLLGFGLHMQIEDVNELLTKGLQEPELNRKNLKEVVCAYCYAHGYGYHRYKNLMDCGIRMCEDLPSAEIAEAHGNANGFSVGIYSPGDLEDEADLMRYIRLLLKDQHSVLPDQEANAQFRLLYRQAQEITADILSAIERDTIRLEVRTMEEKWEKEDQFYQIQKQDWIRKRRERILDRKPEEITPTDIEHVLQAAIPRDRHGNLLPMKRSTLNYPLRGKRLTRQRLEELLTGSSSVTRYDLIMLQFYVYSQRERKEEPRLRYYHRFLEEMNSILEICGMGPLYIPNPFESFLLMCILSEDPMGTYADVMEESYAGAEYHASGVEVRGLARIGKNNTCAEDAR